MGKNQLEQWQDASPEKLAEKGKNTKREELEERVGAEVASIGEGVDYAKIEKERKIEEVLDEWGNEKPTAKLSEKEQEVKDALSDWQNS